MIRSLRSKTSDKTCPPGQVFLLAVDFLQDCGRIFCGKWGDGGWTGAGYTDLAENDDFGIPEGDARCVESCKVYRKGIKWQFGYTDSEHIAVIMPAKYTEKRENDGFGILT